MQCSRWSLIQHLNNKRYFFRGAGAGILDIVCLGWKDTVEDIGDVIHHSASIRDTAVRAKCQIHCRLFMHIYIHTLHTHQKIVFKPFPKYSPQSAMLRGEFLFILQIRNIDW